MSDEEIKRLIDEKEQELAELRSLRNDLNGARVTLRERNEMTFKLFVEKHINPLKSVKGRCYMEESKNDYSVYSDLLNGHVNGTRNAYIFQITGTIDLDSIVSNIDSIHDFLANADSEITEEYLMDVLDTYNTRMEFPATYVGVIEDAKCTDPAKKEIIFGNTDVDIPLGWFLRYIHEIPQEDFDKHMKECLDFVTGNITMTK